MRRLVEPADFICWNVDAVVKKTHAGSVAAVATWTHLWLVGPQSRYD